MISVTPTQRKRLLCLGAHADDLEIGCGGTILQWLVNHPGLAVTWVVFSADAERREEAERSARAFLAGAGQVEVLVESFRDRFFPAQWEQLKLRMGELASSHQPDIVLTHRLEDRHQDHRVIAELTWHAFREQLILEYEIPKFEGDLGQPNLFVTLDEQHAQRKISLLQTHFPSQHGKYWYSPASFQALMHLRGLEARAASGWAEAFQARKLILS